ncbi:MAG: radical SAM protein [Oscillospiraceae bacterium]|nr:radical SAM protein [Oscillospiraceae bacterium]
MRQILPPRPSVSAICGAQKTEQGEYRYTRHCVAVPCAEGTLLYQTLTGELLLLESDEDASACRGELIRRRFLVPESFDDKAYADQFRTLLGLALPKKSGINTFLIYTTLDCNAHCYYCYELGRARPVMSGQTARDAADFILRSRGEEKVRIRWFGGEPLFNRPVIDIITGILRENNVPYTSTMVSNAYLFDEETVRAARDDWNLKYVQITLDGTEEVYNRSKAFIYKEGSPYQRVMRNIGLLLDADISVIIRMNLGRENGEDLLNLADELAQRFPGRKKLRVYAALLKDYGNVKMDLGDVERRIAAYGRLSDRLSKLNLLAAGLTSQTIKTNHCLADNDNGVSILPDGSLGKCEHETDEDLIGSIYAPVPDSSAWSCWKEQIRVPECEDCVHYPVCTELKKCPGTGGTCTPLDRTLKNLYLEQSILFTYEKKKNRDPGLNSESDTAPELC